MKSLFKNSSITKGIVTALILGCIGLLLVDFYIHKDEAHFPWEEEAGFYAVFGFVACVVLVLLAKHVLRPLVMRDEEYYE